MLHFLERNTFAPQLKPGELAARIWYQAIWVSAYWPRQLKPLQQRSPLMPPDDDYYADGLYLRATGDFETAVRAFSAEMDEPGARAGLTDGSCPLGGATVQILTPATTRATFEWHICRDHPHRRCRPQLPDRAGLRPPQLRGPALE